VPSQNATVFFMRGLLNIIHRTSI